MLDDLPFAKQRGLGAGWPLLVIDNAEKAGRLTFTKLPSVTGSLETGDYTIRGLADRVAWEKKEACGDLIGCVPGDSVPAGEIWHDADGNRILSERARFERELHRMQGMEYKAVFVVGTARDIQEGRYHAAINPHAVFGSITRWQTRYGVPFRFFATAADAAAQIEKEAIYIVNYYRQLLAGIEMREPAPAAPQPEKQNV